MVKSYLYAMSYIVCIFPIVTLVLSVIYSQTPYLTGILTELNNSLNDYPLTDLQYSEECSENQHESKIYTVPGSKEGCSCVKVENYIYKQANKYLVFSGKCKKNHTLNGCEYIKPYPEVELKKWYSKKFCSKKYIDFKGYKDFFKYSVGEKDNCQDGFRKCGRLDDFNYLCVPQNESCPINDIIISKQNDSLNDYQKYNIQGTDKYLYFTDNSKNPLITKLKIAEGKLCAGKGYYHTEYPQFILDDHFYNYGCRYTILDSIYDENVTKLDSMSKKELYDYNDFSIYSRYNDSSGFPYFSLNADVFLYPKRYISFNKTCLIENNLDIDDDIFKNENIEIINNSLLNNRQQHNVLMWISIAAIDFYFMTCFFINIDEENNLTNFYIWSIITIPFYLAMNVFAIIGLVSMSNIKKYPLCNDYITNIKIDLFNSKSKKLFIITLIVFININLQLLLTLILFIFKRRKILLNKNNINEVVSSVKSINQDLPLITQTQKE
jgi:hypothetical protein